MNVNPMQLTLAGLVVLMLSGGASVLAGRSAAWSARLGVFGAVAGCALGFFPAVGALAGGLSLSVRIPWPLPLERGLELGLDPLSAVFLVPMTLLGALCAVYGAAYLGKGAGRASWFHYNTLVASMMAVVLARDAVVFLVAWETMALSSFFLVIHEHGRAQARRAAWLYMVATHLGTAFLLAMFAILSTRGSAGFDALARAGAALPAPLAAVLFVFALVGFGTKAGFMPFHVWLPEAHPAAPSHVSPLMSGIMIKTGIYGLLRVLGFLGAPAPWWGGFLLAVGVTSGVLGVLFALAQHDIKRLLAYHSVENIGIIAIGLGLGYLGLAQGLPAVAALGFAGALLHVVNHAVFKGLLFLGAGAVLHGAGTGELDRLGGLLKRMPWTGAAFLVGAAAICGLPPLNGFVSEFLIYLAAFRGVVSPSAAVVVAGLSGLAGLALIGGLAAACFTKAFGVVFLGEPRTERAATAHEAGPAMRWPMAALACLCGAIGVFSPAVLPLLAPAVAVVMKDTPEAATAGVAAAATPLTWIVTAAAVLALLVAALYALRFRLLGARARHAVTWDCGYAAPTPRMQYTASSFAQPLTDLFAPLLRTRREHVPPKGIFPAGTAFSTETDDLFQRNLYAPLFRMTGAALAWFRWAQQGRVQLYVLYIALTLLALLLFCFE